ncbi:nuclear transport factor 2 family protein [Aestuariicella hydrocarbonica]|uniref:Nuclear transport factor 2 family protein n=1 Tax=Pseudomaricurvus hydrocarbonicus TaxID=1470433 RepID=A0A9E5JY73_9GAMM|nr:nuclear transport factor 2 family protein [Aestuariicella hydrocarbonica]NHO66821.1 nuclear transport factor 2 family protein [Aestuariicella hydrocarbonica]
MSFSGNFEDRLMIRELMDTYADGVNQRNAHTWGSTWAEESEWNLPVVPGMEAVKGKSNIIEGWMQGMELFPFVFMAISPGSIQVTGNTATARSYTAEVAVTQDGTELRPRGQYDDKLVKIDGQWLFKQRTFMPIHGE